MSASWAAIRELKRRRPWSPFLRASFVVLAAIAAFALHRVVDRSPDFLSARRLSNFERFLGEIRPYPLQGKPFDAGVALDWAGDYIAEKGGAAALTTLSIATAAAVLTGLLSLVVLFFAARTVATPEPFAPGPRPPGRLRRVGWRLGVGLAKGYCIFVRAMPEFVWAFVLLLFLGPTPWTAVLALALHNSGALGRLTAESVENLPRGGPTAWRLLGASRFQIAYGALIPLVAPRFLLYFFYRFESCVREATVLGMLGIVSIGYHVADARARGRYDELFLLVLLGASLVMLADAASSLFRWYVRTRP